MNDYKLLWGDFHCHTENSYSDGSLDRGMAIADEIADFACFTDQVGWHDLDKSDYTPEKIKVHREGFEKMQKRWPQIQQKVAEHNKKGNSVVFLAQEWHSTAYGDHNVIFLEDYQEILQADGIHELRKKPSRDRAIAIPHHVGYKRGRRGISWDDFDGTLSPVVEMYSLHGCSESDHSPFPLTMGMGPRYSGSTVQHGLASGHKFGMIASTDNAYAHPVSYGQGAAAVYAEEKSRKGIWDAVLNRRTYAVTGDRMKVDFSVNGAIMGSEIQSENSRTIKYSVEGNDLLDKVEIIRNGQIIHRAPFRNILLPASGSFVSKFRIEWGWGSGPDIVEWAGNLKVTGGIIKSVEPCFSAFPFFDDGKWNRIISEDSASCEWQSYTRKKGERDLSRGVVQSLVVELEGTKDTLLDIDLNNVGIKRNLSELMQGSVVEFTGGLCSNAVKIHQVLDAEAYTVSGEFTDTYEDRANYYLRAVQSNGHCAWTSPVFVNY